MAFWLMKSEPSAYSWGDLVREGRTHWDGVRNYQAANNMKNMKMGDRAFFYHSIKDKEIVGIMQIVREYYPDHTDKTDRFGMVDVEPLFPVKAPVTLAQMKADPALSQLALIRQSRLSVLPVSAPHWRIICKMANVKP